MQQTVEQRRQAVARVDRSTRPAEWVSATLRLADTLKDATQLDAEAAQDEAWRCTTCWSGFRPVRQRVARPRCVARSAADWPMHTRIVFEATGQTTRRRPSTTISNRYDSSHRGVTERAGLWPTRV